MEQAVSEEMSNLRLPIAFGLLQNDNPMEFNQALEKPLVILRWRHRVCQTCSESFDISREGRFYRCGRCIT